MESTNRQPTLRSVVRNEKPNSNWLKKWRGFMGSRDWKASDRVSQNRADLVQRFSNAVPLQGSVSFSLSVLPSKAPALPQAGSLHGAKMATEVPGFAFTYLAVPERRPLSWYLRRRKFLSHETQTTSTWVSLTRLCHTSISESLSWLSQNRQGQPKADGLQWGGVDTWKKSLGVARMLARHLTNKCI